MKKCYRAITMVAAITVCSAVAAARPDASLTGRAMDVRSADSWIAIDRDTGGTVHRAPADRAPSIGGSCQNSADAGFNGTTFKIADNFHPLADGVVHQVSFSGYYRKNANPNSGTDNPPPANETFSLVIYESTAVGLPGTVVSSQAITSANFTRVDTGAVINFGTIAAPNNVKIWDHTVTLPAPVNVLGSKCYWLELRNTTVGITGNWRWATATTHADGWAYQIATAGTYSEIANVADDFCFCLDIQFGTAQCGLDRACSQAAANCQAEDFLGSGRTSNGSVQTADNFTVPGPTNGSLSGICFDGFYNSATPPNPDSGFVVRILRDSGTSFPDDANVVATINTADAGVTFKRQTIPGTVNPFGAGLFEYSIGFAAPVTLTPGCYWLEITSLSATQWLWLTRATTVPATPNGGDGYFCQKTGGSYSQASQVSTTPRTDCVFCLSLALAANQNCPPVTAAPNQTCATATSLQIGGPILFGNTITTQASDVPQCLGNYGGFNAVWFTVVGDGTTVTLSTCNTGTNSPPATNFDTTLSVYCGASCAGPFTCVEANDDADECNNGANEFSSSLAFPTVAGQTYYVVLSSSTAASEVGFYYLNAVSNGTPASPPAFPCAQIQRCTITVPPNAVQEADACGATSTNSACDGAGVITLAYGQVGTGTLTNTGFSRDFDFWKFPDITNPNGSWVEIRVNAEIAVAVGRFVGTCPNPTANGTLAQAECDAFPDGSFRLIPAGAFFLNISPLDFDGLTTCGSGNVGNRYTVEVRLVSQVGACCIAGSTCTVLHPFDSSTVDGSCAGAGGTYLGDGNVCTAPGDPNDPSPCDSSGGVPGGAITGSCCRPDTICYISVNTGCADGVFAQGGSCSPNTCPIGVVNCCLTTGYCMIVTPAACVAAGGSQPFSQLIACQPNGCPPPSGACCAINGQCAPTTQAACTGNFLGNGTSCTPNPCPQPVACCFPNGNCTSVLTAACTTNSGTPGNPGSSCSPNLCPQPTTGTCCRGTTCNTSVTQASCTAPSAGIGAVYATGPLGNNCNVMNNRAAPCCYADFNKSAGVTAQDIFDFLAAWFAGSPYARYAGDGTGSAPTAQSIFDFLAAWFLGPCPAYGP